MFSIPLYSMKPQPEHDEEFLAQVVHYPPGAVSRDTPLPWNFWARSENNFPVDEYKQWYATDAY